MSLQDISRDIQSKANLQKEQIEEQTNDAIKTLESQFEKNFSQHKENVLEKYESESKLVSTKISSKYSKISKELELDAKAQILETVKQKALTQILNLSKTDRETLIQKLFKLAKKLIKYDVIYTSKSDLAFVKSLTTDKIKVCSKANLNGLVFETENGLEKLDLNFENLFTDILSENEAELQNILFN